MNKSVIKTTSLVLAGCLATIVLALTISEALSSSRPAEFAAWIGLGLTALSAATAAQSRALTLTLFTAGALLLVAYAAPTFSSAVPFALLFLGSLLARPDKQLRSRWLVIIIALWLVSLGVSNGFNRNWATGAPYAMLSSVLAPADWFMLAAPSAHMPTTGVDPELFDGPFRLDSVRYRALVLGSVLLPIFGAGLLLTPRTQQVATALLVTALCIVGACGWDPALCAVMAFASVLAALYPPERESRNLTLTGGFGVRMLGFVAGAVIILWPHIQRYAATEFDVDGRAYFAQNDHGALSWPIEITLRVKRYDVMPTTVELSEFPELDALVRGLVVRASHGGEFVSCKPLARSFVRLFPDEPEVQISIARFFLDPKHQRISIRGRDQTFKPRSDGRYLRSSYRYTKEFPVDSTHGLQIPPL